jgi:hypothetical protein
MPITEDIRNHEVLGREYQNGRLEGALTILRLVIEKRFGAMPTWVQELLSTKSLSELEELSERVLDVQSLEELLK